MNGMVVGAYQILRRIGVGGMGSVYLAEHTLLKRQAAIKVLLPEMTGDKSVVNRFFNEARAVSAISDPGIVQVFDFGFHTDGSAYIVMELLEGETLSKRIRRLGKLPSPEALGLVVQIASALSAAHAKGVIHRDVKPDNIFMVPDATMPAGERCKVLDFGIAKLTAIDNEVEDPDQPLKTKTGTLIGTPTYMSPEQCRGDEIDPRSDIYALGCVLYCMIVGKPPFSGPPAEMIASHLREEPAPPSTALPMLDPIVDEIVMRCLAKKPDKRYASMLDLADAARAAEAQLNESGFYPKPSTTKPRPAVGPVARLSTPMPRMPTPPSGVSIPAPPPPEEPTVGVPTTFSLATGEPERDQQPPKRKRAAIGFGLLLAGAAAGATFVMTRGGDGDDGTRVAEPPTTHPAPAAQPPPPPPEPQHAKAPDPQPEQAKPEVAKPEAAPAPVATAAKATVKKPPKRPAIKKPEVAKPEVAKPEIKKPETKKPDTPPKPLDPKSVNRGD